MAKGRFSRHKDFKKKSIDGVPKDKPIVYEILGSKGNNLYTGHAKKGQVSNRLGDHLMGAKDAVPGGKFFRIKQFGSVREAEVEEKTILKREKPKCNKTGV